MSDTVDTVDVVEIFASLQGEGANTGFPVVFVRLAPCNLSCPWCDTDRSHAEKLSFAEIASRVASFGQGRAIVTGGEPTVLGDALARLVDALRADGICTWVGLETNGLIAPPPCFDYVAVSPKAEYADRYEDTRMCRRADEVRIVASVDDVVPFAEEMRRRIEAERYFISPCERNGTFNFDAALAAIADLNAPFAPNEEPWRLSLQTHKLAGFK